MITVEDIKKYLSIDDKPAEIIYNWLDNYDCLDKDIEEMLSLDTIEHLCETADSKEDADIVADALDIYYRNDDTFDEDFDSGDTYFDDDYFIEDNNSMKNENNLCEDTHDKYAKPAGNKIASFNNALKYAKKENKPFIYGYSDTKGKFFALEQPISCTDLKKETANIHDKYKNSVDVYVAYPDKEEVEESLENNDENFDLSFDDFLNQAEVLIVDDAEKFDINDFEDEIQDEISDVLEEDNSTIKAPRKYLKYRLNDDMIKQIVEKISQAKEFNIIDYWKTKQFLKKNNLKKDDLTDVLHNLSESDYKTNSIPVDDTDDESNEAIIFIKKSKIKDLGPFALFIKLQYDTIEEVPVIVISFHTDFKKNKDNKIDVNESLTEEKQKLNLSEGFDDINTLLAELENYSENPSPLNIKLIDKAINESIEPIEDQEKDNLSEYELKKKRTLEYYNKIKDWAGDDAINRTSSKYLVGVDKLNEWLKESNND